MTDQDNSPLGDLAGAPAKPEPAITRAQIRAGRGMLDWTQEELSARTGISATSIGAIESGKSTPHQSTEKRIKTAFETAGLTFFPGAIIDRAQLLKTLYPNQPLPTEK